MPKTMKEVLATLPDGQNKKIEERTQALIRATTLRELRKNLGISQKQLAESLKVSQPAVSKQERRQGIQVGTLCEVIEAMGGSVEITARFPGNIAVKLMPSAI